MCLKNHSVLKRVEMFLFDTYTTVIIVIKQLVRNFMLNALIPIVLLSLLFAKMHRNQECLNLYADCLPETSCFYRDFQVGNTGSIGGDQTKFQTKNVCRELCFIRK